MARTDADRAYDKGYEDGKKGGPLDDFTQSLKDTIPIDVPNESSYDGGYRDGVADRFNKESKHYRGGKYQWIDFEKKKKEEAEKKIETKKQKEAIASNTGGGGGGGFSASGGEGSGLLTLAVIIIVVLAILWLIFKLIIPCIILNLAAITLLCSFITRDKGILWRFFSVLAGIYVVVDYNNGWITTSLPKNVPVLVDSIQPMYYANVACSFLAVFFMARHSLNSYFEPADSRHEIKRSIGIALCIGALGVVFFCIQNNITGSNLVEYLKNPEAELLPPSSSDDSDYLTEKAKEYLPKPAPTIPVVANTAQNNAPIADEYLSIPEDENSFPKQDKILGDLKGKDDELYWAFKESDVYDGFKVIKSEVTDNTLIQLIYLKVLRGEPVKRWHLNVEVKYKFKQNDQWQLTAWRIASFPLDP
jgi:hypothetical protein